VWTLQFYVHKKRILIHTSAMKSVGPCSLGSSTLQFCDARLAKCLATWTIIGPHRPWQSRSQSIVFEGHQCDYWTPFEGFFSRVSTGQTVVAVWKMEIPEVHRYSNLALWAILSSQTVDTLISSRFYHVCTLIAGRCIWNPRDQCWFPYFQPSNIAQ
jgi:hypothetical protein